MKVGMQLRMSATQQLALTPQLQQSIKLLQLSTLELEQEIEKILLENPLLEREDSEQDSQESTERNEFSQEQLANQQEFESNQNEASFNDDFQFEPSVTEQFETPSFDSEFYINQESDKENYKSNEHQDVFGEFQQYTTASSQSNENDDDFDFCDTLIVQQTFHEFLTDQVRLLPVDDSQKKYIFLLMDYLNDDGYLIQEIQEIAIEHSSPQNVIDPQDLNIALKYLQNLEPNGIGARNLAECLEIQLKQLPTNTKYINLAINIVQNHLQLLANKDYQKLKKLLQCDIEDIKATHHLIKQLNPKPASHLIPSENFYIIPDVIVKKDEKTNEWIATLNTDVMPKLRVNQLYASILQQHRNKNHSNDQASFQELSTHLQEAKWFIKNVQQRFDTILRVSQAIIEKQSDFLESGEEAMKPLVLREIAEEVSLHESTISRVTTQKYMLTPRGVYELKYFFGSYVATDDGGSRSATSIKAMIKKLIADENPKKPLSDNQISEILAKQGIIVARRTVAKYRETMNLLPVSQRKSMY